MIVVANTTPLIGLASIQRFDLLQHIFGQVNIAQAVYDEVMNTGGRKKIAQSEVSASPWIQIVSVRDRTAVLELTR